MRLNGFRVPVSVLSPSSIATFMICPEQFRVERVKKRRSRRGLEGFIGSVHHEAVETLLRTRMASGTDPTLGDLQTAYDGAWNACIEEEEPEWKQMPDDVKGLGQLMLATFAQEALPGLSPTYLESRFEDTIPGVPVPLVGIVDVVEEHRTVEMKTTGQKLVDPKAKWVAQARIYQLFTDLPVDFIITTRQVTPKVYQSSDDARLRLAVGDPDVTVRSVVQAVEQMNDLYSRYGPDEPWPLHGLMHQYQCGYCIAGPKNPDPICPAWRIRDKTPA